MDSSSGRDSGEERIGLGAAAAILRCPSDAVRRYVSEGRLRAEEASGGYSFDLEDVEALARDLGVAVEDEIFEGEVMGEDATEGSSRLPAVPFERYERLLQQGQDYKTRLEERSRQVEEVRSERDAARVDGVGNGSPSGSGWSDYGSLGQYRLTSTGCEDVPTLPILADLRLVERNEGNVARTFRRRPVASTRSERHRLRRAQQIAGAVGPDALFPRHQGSCADPANGDDPVVDLTRQ